MEKISIIYKKESVKLVFDTREYLLDAGFPINFFRIEDFNNERGYVEVFFKNCYGSIDYIIRDIKKTPFKKLLEIKKYKHKTHHTAIFAYH